MGKPKTKTTIESFVASVNTDTDIDAAWEEYVKQRKQDDLNEIIASENLKADETDKFMANAFRDGAMRTTGTDIDKILPAMSRFGGGNRQEKKKTVIEKAFFEKHFGVLSENEAKVSFLSQIEFAIFCDMMSIKLAIAIS